MANKTLDIGSYYWTLRGADFYNHSSDWQGENIFRNILEAGEKGGIKIRIAQSAPSSVSPNLDTEILAKRKAAEVRSVDFNRLFGAGVLHTKLWIADGKHMYVGSANNDWRSLTQVWYYFSHRFYELTFKNDNINFDIRTGQGTRCIDNELLVSSRWRFEDFQRLLGHGKEECRHSTQLAKGIQYKDKRNLSDSS